MLLPNASESFDTSVKWQGIYDGQSRDLNIKRNISISMDGIAKVLQFFNGFPLFICESPAVFCGKFFMVIGITRGIGWLFIMV